MSVPSDSFSRDRKKSDSSPICPMWEQHTSVNLCPTQGQKANQSSVLFLPHMLMLIDARICKGNAATTCNSQVQDKKRWLEMYQFDSEKEEEHFDLTWWKTCECTISDPLLPLDAYCISIPCPIVFQWTYNQTVSTHTFKSHQNPTRNGTSQSAAQENCTLYNPEELGKARQKELLDIWMIGHKA